MRRTLATVVGKHPSTHLLPRAFMLAWHGVPVLVYQGFSPSLSGLKRNIARVLDNLPPEAPGSRWPKTGLGALADDRPLSPATLRQLREVCAHYTAALGDVPALRVACLHWVHYECRSLERRLDTTPMPLAPAATTVTRPDPAECRRVETVLGEFARANLAAYLSRVNHEGHRIDHYRAKASGRSLVFDLADQSPPVLGDFIKAVEAVLPGRFTWFDPTSRHVTIRRLSL